MRCNLCGAIENFEVLSHKIREGEGLILQCSSCKHVFQGLEMTGSDLEEYYNDIYTATNSLSDSQLDVRQHFETRLKTLDDLLKHLRPHLKKEMNVLDVGSGAGSLLWSIKDEVGGGLYATELNKSYVAFMNSLGINAQYGFFEKLEFDTKFDLIISIAAIDHMPNPMEILSKIYDSLEADGKIYIELPNRNEALNFYLPKENQENFNTFWHKAHFSYFYEETARFALEKIGFKNIKIDFRHQYTILNFLHWYYLGGPQKTSINASLNTSLYNGSSDFEIRLNELFAKANTEFHKVMKETKNGDMMVITAEK